jgi:phenylpyruvate tautomerase PptA (4-oxalocrotonate tautomerase family)
MDRQKESIMPFVQINLPAGSASQDVLRKMVADVTDAVVAAEGGSDFIRENCWVQIVEVADGGWGMAGTAYTTSQIKAAVAAAEQS